MISTETYNAIRDITQLIIALAAVIIASRGLSTWRNQLRGGHEFELAKKIMSAAYELQDEIKAVRNPFVQGNPEEVYQSRWNGALKAARLLKSSLLEAQVVWDKTSARKIRTDMDFLLGMLYTAMDNHLLDRVRKPQTADDQLFTKEQRDTLYAGGKDSYGTLANDFVEHVEKYVQPHLKK